MGRRQGQVLTRAFALHPAGTLQGWEQRRGTVCPGLEFALLGMEPRAWARLGQGSVPSCIQPFLIFCLGTGSRQRGCGVATVPPSLASWLVPHLCSGPHIFSPSRQHPRQSLTQRCVPVIPAPWEAR